MSWSLFYNSRRDFEEDRRQPHDKYVTEGPAEVQEQVSAARAAAKALIDSGVVGEDTNIPGGHKDFTVSIGGHANPGHEPTPQYANDCISVSISQKSNAANLSGSSRADIADQKRADAGAAVEQSDGSGSGGLEEGDLGEGTDEELARLEGDGGAVTEADRT